MPPAAPPATAFGLRRCCRRSGDDAEKKVLAVALRVGTGLNVRWWDHAATTKPAAELGLKLLQWVAPARRGTARSIER
jgi:hypothetical protein